jgi:hypothetical protein
MQQAKDRIIEQLAWEMTSWESIRFVVEQRMTVAPAPLRAFQENVIRWHYQETALGWRRFEAESIENGKGGFHHLFTFDGKEYIAANYELGNTTKQSWFSPGGSGFGREDKRKCTERPRPLLYYYYGKIPLHEALRDADYVGKETVGGFSAHVFVFKKTDLETQPGDIRVALDTTHSIPVGYSFADTSGNKLWNWEALKIATVKGFHFPVESAYWDLFHDGEPVRLDYTVSELEYNHAFTEADFRVAPQPGVQILPGPKARSIPKSQSAPKAKTAATVVPTARAEQHSSAEGGLSGLLLTQLLLGGLGVVMLGVYLRERFRTV